MIALTFITSTLILTGVTGYKLGYSRAYTERSKELIFALYESEVIDKDETIKLLSEHMYR